MDSDKVLKEQYRAALKAYRDAVAAMAGLTGTPFIEAMQRADDALRNFEEIRNLTGPEKLTPDS